MDKVYLVGLCSAALRLRAKFIEGEPNWVSRNLTTDDVDDAAAAPQPDFLSRKYGDAEIDPDSCWDPDPLPSPRLCVKPLDTLLAK